MGEWEQSIRNPMSNPNLFPDNRAPRRILRTPRPRCILHSHRSPKIPYERQCRHRHPRQKRPATRPPPPPPPTRRNRLPPMRMTTRAACPSRWTGRSPKARKSNIQTTRRRSTRSGKILYARQRELMPGRACQEYIDGLQMLNLPEDRVPALRDVSAVLEKATGWKLTRSPGFVARERFLRAARAACFSGDRLHASAPRDGLHARRRICFTMFSATRR